MKTNKDTVTQDYIIKIAAEIGAKTALEMINHNSNKANSRLSNEIYKATERRLKAIPILQEKIDYDKERIKEYELGMSRDKGKSITRFNKSGSRISQEEMIEVLKQDLVAQVAAAEHEIKLLKDALKCIENDVYYKAIVNRYFQQQSDAEIANQIPCDESTVRRNRGRLIRKVAIRLYGVDAI